MQNKIQNEVIQFQHHTTNNAFVHDKVFTSQITLFMHIFFYEKSIQMLRLH